MSTQPHLTLYQGNGACSFVPHSLLVHLGLPHTTFQMKYGAGGYVAFDDSMTNADYREKIHPKGYVPALTFPDENGKTTFIYENPVIIAFITSLAGDAGAALMGSTQLEKSRVLYWTYWASASLHDAFIRQWRSFRFVDTEDEAVRKHIIDKGRSIMLEDFAKLDAHLKAQGGPHMVGGRLTVADFYIYIFYRWAALFLKMDMAKDYPHYTQHAKNMETVPAVQATLKAEEQEAVFKS